VRLLADESCCDRSIVQALRNAGHDVRVVAIEMRGADDDVVAEASVAQDRILITKDRDFGRLVFAKGAATTGVIYVRWPVVLRARLPGRLVALLDEMGDRLAGAFVVLRPARVRVRRRPVVG
jgi:predicted nuclease of predicted toxin-antitoxin system